MSATYQAALSSDEVASLSISLIGSRRALFPYLYSRANTKMYFMGLVWELNELIRVKPLEQCQAHKCPISIICAFPPLWALLLILFPLPKIPSGSSSLCFLISCPLFKLCRCAMTASMKSHLIPINMSSLDLNSTFRYLGPCIVELTIVYFVLPKFIRPQGPIFLERFYVS